VSDKLAAMSELLTIKVSDQVARFASQVAKQSNLPVEEVISDLLESAINEIPVECLSDEKVLALSEMKFSDEQDAILSDLLARQRENQLDNDGRRQLNELMRIYERDLLRKAQALRVAVERGLREPLSF
jgi:antitoxin component of RelBE/YafQ-DinJ toxin-antitoxin module